MDNPYEVMARAKVPRPAHLSAERFRWLTMSDLTPIELELWTLADEDGVCLSETKTRARKMFIRKMRRMDRREASRMFKDSRNSSRLDGEIARLREQNMKRRKA